MTTVSQKADNLRPARHNWDIATIVGELRSLREESLAQRHRQDKPLPLPSRASLSSAIEGLTATLFPNRLGNRPLASQVIDYFVGQTLDNTLSELMKQVARELRFVSRDELSAHEIDRQAFDLVDQFSHRLPTIRSLLDSDIAAIYEGDPAARSVDEVLACYPGITAIIHHRFAHALYDLGAPLVARIMAELAHSITGIDIHPGAKIDESFFIDHGTGVVIGETAVIGKRVRLYHGVTLGAKSVWVKEEGSRAQNLVRHPTVEDDVIIYSGATILGPITVGRGSVIGGNVWVTRTVPAGSVISQAKVSHELFDGGAGI